MKTLANATVTKLRESAQSYGAPETIRAAFIKEFNNEIQLFDELGRHQRTMRKGTKLLISFDGKEITERTFDLRTNKALKAHKEDLAERKLIEEAQWVENRKLADAQLIEWTNFLKENPAKIEKYLGKIKVLNSSKWRNYLKMKFAFACNNESFQNIHLSGSQLRDAILEIQKYE